MVLKESLIGVCRATTYKLSKSTTKDISARIS